MNLSFFTAYKIKNNTHTSFSKVIIRLATWGTALSVAIMIIAIAVVQGFKKNIENKLLIFWGDFHVSIASPTGMMASGSFLRDEELEKNILDYDNINSLTPFALKPSILKGDGPLHGIRLKGINKDYAFENNESIKYEGQTIFFEDTSYSTDIMLSPEIMGRLNIGIGDHVIAYFLQEGQSSPKIRKLTVVGSFHTGVGEIDNTFGICDIKLIQALNNWSNIEISGYEIEVEDKSKISETSNAIYEKYVEPPLISETVKNMYPGIFSWINAQDINARVLLIIMSIVAIINIATALLIYILERHNMVGLFKALGMKNRMIQKIFIYHAMWISLRGILIGNVIAGIISYLQLKYKFIKLDEEIYYMEHAPIYWTWTALLIVNLATLLLTLLLMNIPSLLVRKMNIISALKFK